MAEVVDLTEHAIYRAFLAHAFEHGTAQTMAVVKKYVAAGREILLANVPDESRRVLLAELQQQTFV